MNIIPKDLSRVVRDIKLAILQTRARAAHASNADGMKRGPIASQFVTYQVTN